MNNKDIFLVLGNLLDSDKSVIKVLVEHVGLEAYYTEDCFSILGLNKKIAGALIFGEEPRVLMALLTIANRSRYLPPRRTFPKNREQNIKDTDLYMISQFILLAAEGFPD